MRRPFNPQYELGVTPIEDIAFNVRSRDDVPQLLKGLQHIYTNKNIFDAVLEVLNTQISQAIDFDNGRPGMDLWILLVLGTLRLGLGCDYDRLQELANEHKTLRNMLGHGVCAGDHQYGLQTLKDNVSLLTEEMLLEINEIVVKAGHELLKKNKDEKLKGRCDSFVVETDVEYPTDTGMLFDAVRKTISSTAKLCKRFGIGGWRQSAYNIQRLKNHWRKAQKSSRSRKADAEEIKSKAYKSYLREAKKYYQKSLESVEQLQAIGKDLEPKDWNKLQKELEEIGGFQEYAELLMDQVNRRVLKNEVIPQEEKIFSIFEPHTEWISKGKAGVPVEFGLRVCIVEDQYQFILHHQVMENVQDVDIAVSIVTETQSKFSDLSVCSFDKGFHSPDNQKSLAKYLDEVVLPKKGKLSSEEKTKERAIEFRKARRQHSAVESAINALEQNGLDRCPDHGIDGFKRYVALGVLSRNIQRIGTLLIAKEREKLKRQQRGICTAQAA